MTDAPERERFSLKRWSDRKRAAVRESAPPEALAAGRAAAPPETTAPAAAHDVNPPGEPVALPPVESLTFDADFTAYMKPDVDPSLKRAALKKLFADPRFNVMDGLDVYIDDYSKPDPIDAETVRGLVQARYLFDPPKTRINERGEAEDVPPEADAPGDASPPLVQDASTIAAEGDVPAPAGAVEVPVGTQNDAGEPGDGR
jgi:hypothetical protein